MTILLVGGGTGGHITPLLAIAHELKILDPKVHTVHVGERNGKFQDLARHDDIDESYSVFAGKFRRYHGESWLVRLTDYKTNLQNIRDALFAAIGFVQSLRLLYRIKPNVIFIKGGFVGVPVGLAAACLGIPFVTHDSDVLPGLANRIIGRWAKLHAVGMPKEFYNYPASKMEYVGIPLSNVYVPVDTQLQQRYRNEIGVAAEEQILVIIGGSLGAQRLNEAMANIASSLLSAYPHLVIVHQVGDGNGSVYRALADSFQKRVQVHEFIKDIYRYTGAADVVITRAGATSLAELAMQRKACILVPNPLLTGGHQLKNANELEQKGAVAVVQEAQIVKNKEVLLLAVRKLLDNKSKRQVLASNIGHLAKPHAAKELAQLIVANAV